MWNPLQKLKEKFGGAKPPPEPAPAPSKIVEAAAGGMPDMKDLEKKGLLRQFFRHWKDPAFLKQVQGIVARMQADGVDVKDQKAVKAWVEKHQAEVSSGQITAPSAEAPKTFVKTGPDIGRNDPCHCGSGKKFKKCHGG
ncbi:MAG: SEC-C metal-binding domain-containing protein [Elusimicrobiota bacterium]